MDNLIGKDLGRYHITEQLGQGGMATVYKAYDTRLEREVAIKVIRTDLFGQAVIERILKRFEREAKALARLDHMHIIKVHDYGEHDGSPYLVMQYIPAGTLKALIGQVMPCTEASRLLAPVARALAYAHQQGILHRDIKPSNILITQSGEPVLTDFGIAKLLESTESHTLTGTGVGVGTPEYMAPEQGLGKAIDGRADVYALGIVFYELVTGRKPYTADTPMAVLLKQFNDPLPRPRDYVPGLSEDAEKILFKALAKQPEDRYENMEAFAAALERLALGEQTAAIPALQGTVSPQTTIENHEDLVEGLEPEPVGESAERPLQPAKMPDPDATVDALDTPVLDGKVALVNESTKPGTSELFKSDAEDADSPSANEEIGKTVKLSKQPSGIKIGVILSGIAILVVFCAVMMGSISLRNQNSNQTATAHAKATTKVRKTATAHAEATKEARKTATAIAQATQQVREFRTEIQALQSQESLIFGPTDGELEHEEDDYIETYRPWEIDQKDFILEVTFITPYNASNNCWDIGIIFRDAEVEGGEFYELTIQSGALWTLDNRTGSANSPAISSGYVPNLNTKKVKPIIFYWPLLEIRATFL